MPIPRKKIVAVDKDGSMAGSFESVRMANKVYGLTCKRIIKSCRTGKLYRGVRWMYDDEYRKWWLEGRTAELAYARPPGQKPMQRGDKAARGASQATLTGYLRSLIHHFGEDVTLKEIKEKLS